MTDWVHIDVPDDDEKTDQAAVDEQMALDMESIS